MKQRNQIGLPLDIPVNYSIQSYAVGERSFELKTLSDRNQYYDPEGQAEMLGVPPAHWSLFGVVWASGELLAHVISTIDIKGRRILELGCGMALPSLVLQSRGADVTASDYHPLAEDFLKFNTSQNQLANIPFVRLNWAELAPIKDPFDLIIGSDLLYEDAQIQLLAQVIDHFSHDKTEVIIVDPGRKRMGLFSSVLEKLHFNHEVILPPKTYPTEKIGKLSVHRYNRTPL